MNDLPRQKLAELVARYGHDLSEDARRCEALLRDVCAPFKRENFVLVSAVKERVAAELAAPPDGIPSDVRLTRLTYRLHTELGLPEEMARWGVESWALALGVVAESEVARQFVCPVCGARGRSSAGQAGKVGRCPKCLALIRVSADGRHFTPEAGTCGASGGARGTINAPASGSRTIFDDEPSERPEDVLREALRKVLATGAMSEEQKANMQDLRRSLGIERELASQIFLNVQEELNQRRNSVSPPLRPTTPQTRNATGSGTPGARSKKKTLVVVVLCGIGVAGVAWWQMTHKRAEKPGSSDVQAASVSASGSLDPSTNPVRGAATDLNASLVHTDECIGSCEQQLRQLRAIEDIEDNLRSATEDHDRLANQIEQADAEGRWPARLLGIRVGRESAIAARTAAELLIARQQKAIGERKDFADQLGAYLEKLKAARIQALSTADRASAGRELEEMVAQRPTPAQSLSPLQPIDVPSLLK